MMKLLLGTTNPSKIVEIKEALSDIPVRFVTLTELSVLEKPEETGKSFEENAILKARFYAQKAGMPALADDGGLEIEALDGWPGIHSHRIEGAEASDENLIQRVLERLKNVPAGERKARFKIAVAVVSQDGRALLDTESTMGEIAREPSPRRQEGYPYRSIFWLPREKKFFIDLSPKEHEEVNHRRRLLERLKPKIVKFLEMQQGIEKK